MVFGILVSQRAGPTANAVFVKLTLYQSAQTLPFTGRFTDTE